MKKTIYLIGLFLIMQLSTSAQDDKSKINELGVSISGSAFGIRFKSGNEKTLLRLTLLSTNGSLNKQKTPSDSKSKSNNFGLGFNAGFEKRKSVSDNFYLYYGSDLINSFYKYKHEDESAASVYKQASYSVGIGFILGFHYMISSKINISSEIIPSIIYSNEKYSSEQAGNITEYSNSGLDYGLNHNSINLTLSFNF
jgi:hypothetical protein